MRPSNRTVPVALATLTAALALSAAALGQPAASGRTLIVPGKSIGGVAIGDTLAKAKRIWGRPRTCLRYTFPIRGIQCTWRNAPEVDATLKGRVRGLLLAGPGARLASFRTAQGIGLGSSLAALKAAYPHMRSHHYPGGRAFTWIFRLSAPHGRGTGFFVGPKPPGGLAVVQIVIS